MEKSPMPKPKINHFRRYVELEIAQLSRKLTPTERRQDNASYWVVRRVDWTWIDAKTLIVAAKWGLVTFDELMVAGVLDSYMQTDARREMVCDLLWQITGINYNQDDPVMVKQANRSLTVVWLGPVPQEKPTRKARLSRGPATAPMQPMAEGGSAAAKTDDDAERTLLLGALTLVLRMLRELPTQKPPATAPVEDPDPDLPDQAQIDATAADLLADVEVDL
jgi:hypothetical protein